MTRTKQHTLGAVAGGLVPLVLFFGSGCSESVQSRANTGESPTVKSTAPDDATQPVATATASARFNATAERGEQPDNSNQEEASSSQRPASEKADANNHSTTAQPTSVARKTTREITFDTLKFDIEKGQPFKRTMLTPAVEKLEGRRVRIRGYMLPSFQQSGIKQFVLVRDNMECCFGPGAALYDCVIVEMVNDQSCEFSVRPIAVEGTFSIREFKGPDDMHLAIFHLDGERVR